MGSFDKLVLWLFGDRKKARDVAERHHATVTANLPTGLEGDAQDGMDGMLYGGVIWPVEPGTHGAKAFLSAWCFLAYYDGQKQECYMLDDLDGTRHPGAIPLKVGKDLKVQSGEKRSGRGMVIRSAEEGEEGQLKNVFQHYEPNLVAHHLPPNQPDNSSLVGDPDADGRAGGLHYPLRVRQWVRKFCSNATHAVKEVLFAPLLNMRLKNGDGTDAGGGATFARGEAALSDEAKGPLACADDGNHRLGETDESTIHQGANNIQTLYGPVMGGLYMPEEVVEDQWDSGSKGPFVMRVEKRPDLLAQHKNYCKKDVTGVLKWQSWAVIREYFPSIVPDPEPEPKPDPDPTPKPTYPAMLVPPESGFPPTAGTPYELESPSQYGHPMPSIPDGPAEQPDAISRYKDRSGLGEDEGDPYGALEESRRRVENDYERRLERARADIARRNAASAERRAQRVAEREARKNARAGRPEVPNDAERRIEDARRDIEERDAARAEKRAKSRAEKERDKALERVNREAERLRRRQHGAASESKWRAKRAAESFWLNRFGHTEEAWHNTPVASHRFTVPEYQFSTPRDQGERWPAVKDRHGLVEFDAGGAVQSRIAATGPGKTVEAPAWSRPWHVFKTLWQSAWRESRHLFLIFAGKSSAGVTVAGKGGIGVALPNVANVVSGWQYELDFSTSSTEPDINWTKRDASGANAGVGTFKVNGVAVGSSLLQVTKQDLPLSGDVDDQSVTSSLLLCNPSTATRTITGFAAAAGALVKVENIGAVDLVLSHQGGTSDAANRMISPTGFDITLSPNDGVWIAYDATTSRWRINA